MESLTRSGRAEGPAFGRGRPPANAEAPPVEAVEEPRVPVPAPPTSRERETVRSTSDQSPPVVARPAEATPRKASLRPEPGAPGPGWEELDNKAGPALDGVEDGSLDELRVSHLLQRLPDAQLLPVVQAWVRKLKPGGILSVAVPCFERAQRLYKLGHIDKVGGWLMGGQGGPDDFNHSLFFEMKLGCLLETAGLDLARRWWPVHKDAAAHPVSLCLRATKPPLSLHGMFGAISLPRLTHSDNAFSIAEAVGHVGMQLTQSTGAFWGQALTRAYQAAIKAGAEFILAIDYDSVFTSTEIAQLHDLMRENDLDVVFAMQSGRERSTMLFTMNDENGAIKRRVTEHEMAQPLIEARTGHFGLTLIRVSSLAKVPKPWYWSKPDKNNEWEEGRIDDDIWFWQQCAAAGVRAWQANYVVAGHFEQVIAYPDNETLESRHQYAHEYRAKGKPPWSR